MSRQNAIVVDLSEYRRQRQAKAAAREQAAQAPAPLMWYWVWVVPVGCPTLHANGG